jgi:drug/metabolite transporter (DMT)-like permease
MKLLSSALNRLNNSPYILLLFSPMFWGGNIVLGRAVNQLIPPVSLAFWRWTIALVIMVPFTWRYVQKDWPVIREKWKILLLLGFFGVTCFNTMLYKAVHTTTAINGALIQSSMPAWIILLSLFLFRERISLRQTIGMMICIVGALHIVIHGNWNSITRLSFVEGDLWMIVAVILYAAYSALLKRRPAISDWSLLVMTFAMGAAMLFPIYLWELSWAEPLKLTWQVGGSILYVAVFPSILAYLCWNRGIELIGANRAGLYINFTPVFASVLAVLLLNESLFLFHFVGVALIVGGMILFNRREIPGKRAEIK